MAALGSYTRLICGHRVNGHRAEGLVLRENVGCVRLERRDERSERCRPVTILVWNNRKVANLVNVQSLFFALVVGSPRGLRVYS
jgi:hypothetical protein